MFRRQKQSYVSTQEVVLIQTFVESIDDLFETITSFLDLTTNRDKHNYNDKFLLKMNQILIQSLNTFGVTCNNYKSNKKLMMIGTEQYEKNWSDLSESYKREAVKYGRYMECALTGKQKMKLYPLIARSKENRAKVINEKSVNEAYSQMIGGQCNLSKKQQAIRDDFTTYGKTQDRMYNSQNKRKERQHQKTKKRNRQHSQQPTPHEMISVPGVNKKDIIFANNSNHHNHNHQNHQNHQNHHNHNGGHCCSDHKDKEQEQEGVMYNTCIVQAITLNNNTNGFKLDLQAGHPVFITKDNGSNKDIKFAYIEKYGNIEFNVPSSMLCSDVSQIKNHERIHIMENGQLGYKSLLDDNQVNDLKKSHQSMMRSLCTSFT